MTYRAIWPKAHCVDGVMKEITNNEMDKRRESGATLLYIMTADEHQFECDII